LQHDLNIRGFIKQSSNQEDIAVPVTSPKSHQSNNQKFQQEFGSVLGNLSGYVNNDLSPHQRYLSINSACTGRQAA
jgi:hypothetical protein